MKTYPLRCTDREMKLLRSGARKLDLSLNKFLVQAGKLQAVLALNKEDGELVSAAMAQNFHKLIEAVLDKTGS